MNIGIVISEVRKHIGLTQQDLSDLTNISVRTLQRIENDKVEPSLYSLKNLSKILKIDLLKIRANNSMQYTSRILGISLKDLTMKSETNISPEQRLEMIESHLESISRTRSVQLRIRKRLFLFVGILLGVSVLVLILGLLGVLG